MMRAKKQMRAFAEAEGEEFCTTPAWDGTTMECVCPKCGHSHRMKLLWAGRGRPKKFCQPCKAWIGTLETVELHCMPAAVGRVGD
jgi:hypothetical protein